MERLSKVDQLQEMRCQVSMNLTIRHSVVTLQEKQEVLVFAPHFTPCLYTPRIHHSSNDITTTPRQV